MYYCDICDFQTTRQSIFYSHLNGFNHKKKSTLFEKKVNQCKVCKYTASLTENMNEHECSVHTIDEYSIMLSIFNKYKDGVLLYTHSPDDFIPFEKIYTSFKYWYHNNISRNNDIPYPKNSLMSYLCDSPIEYYHLNLYGVQFKNNMVTNYNNVTDIFSNYANSRLVKSDGDKIPFWVLWDDFRKWYHYFVNSQTMHYSEKNIKQFIKESKLDKFYLQSTNEIIGFKIQTQTCKYDHMFDILEKWKTAKLISFDIRYQVTGHKTIDKLFDSFSKWYADNLMDSNLYNKDDLLFFFEFYGYRIDGENVNGLILRRN